MSTTTGNEKLIAVTGATERQGGGRELANEVVEADLSPPESLTAAFKGAHGLFLVTNFWEEGTDEAKTFSYFRAHTYLGSASHERIVHANKIAGWHPSSFSTWARVNVPAQAV